MIYKKESNNLLKIISTVQTTLFFQKKPKYIFPIILISSGQFYKIIE